jgi:hypothetical protein
VHPVLEPVGRREDGAEMSVNLKQLEELANKSIALENDPGCWFSHADLEYPAVEMVDADIAFIAAASPSVVLELIRALEIAAKVINVLKADEA